MDNHDEAMRQQVLNRVREIPTGWVISYGVLGGQCEPPISGYICGRILQNVPADVPWWRVVAKDGKLPISKRSPHLAIQQREKLEAEGVGFEEDGRVKMNEFSL